ncbi:ABC transporter permease [Clostridium aminobutyricum]|uniref:ABC transporter permease n=1 Tax=Clostridium aminobutyricum TaxID=33953 RepID=A0A939IHD6_CLOAM|nr:ABC transporter permease [Clostridium aminobutyricum]MBN7773622.1 ABC transporter permease [Clostridium aminobutyricum]
MKKSSIVKFLFQRLVKLMSLLMAVCLITFVLMECSPIDPVTAYVGADTKVGAEQRALIGEHWGLNKPPVERFTLWFTSILQGDWGTSMIYRRPVLEVIGQKFSASLALMGLAWALSGIIGFILGIIAGIREGKVADKLICAYCHLLISTPSFWLGMVFIMVFAVHLGWFPVAMSAPAGVLAEHVSLLDRISHIVLPAWTLSLLGIAGICLHTRGKVTDVMRSDFIVFAKARGENTKSIVLNHVVKNVSLPAITLQFLSFSELFGGAIFVEQVFSYPGLGQAVVQSGLRGDVPLLMGIVIISLIFVYIGNMTADLLYRVIDPRVREAHKGQWKTTIQSE